MIIWRLLNSKSNPRDTLFCLHADHFFMLKNTFLDILLRMFQYSFFYIVLGLGARLIISECKLYAKFRGKFERNILIFMTHKFVLL
jgi:hypothetical protein